MYSKTWSISLTDIELVEIANKLTDSSSDSIFSDNEINDVVGAMR